jgi:hypothetical protein
METIYDCWYQGLNLGFCGNNPFFLQNQLPLDVVVKDFKDYIYIKIT